MTCLERYSDQVDSFIDVCHQLSAKAYVTGHGGNLAWKLEDDLILITPTQMSKGQIGRGDVVFIRSSGEKVEGERRPTGETPMYVNFFRERPDIASALHCHPPATGAFAITQGMNWLMRPIFPETITELGPAPVVPYGEPLTQRLADNFSPYLQRYNAFLMENHGLVLVSTKDIAWAFLLTELLEGTASSILQALALGEIKEIGKEDLRNLENTMRTRSVTMFGAPGVNRSLVDVYYPGDAA